MAGVLLSLPFSGVVTASHDNATATSNLTLTVSERVEVTVEPDTFEFLGMDVPSTDFSDTPDHRLIVQNDGSTNVTNVYAHLDTLQSEQDNPLGRGQAKEYAAGRFIWIKNQTSRFYHAGTLSWNVTENAGGEPSGITNDPGNAVAHGFYRNATGDYLWALSANGTDGTLDQEWCNSSTVNPPVLTLKNVSDTGDNRDLSTDVVELQPQDADRNGNWSVYNPNNGPNNAGSQHNPLESHYIAMYKDCTKFYIYRFDAYTGFPLAGNRDHHLIDKTLAPGEEYSGRIGAAVPSGIPEGTTNQTTLTLHARHTG